jgi:hypothetical protein
VPIADPDGEDQSDSEGHRHSQGDRVAGALPDAKPDEVT